MNIYTLMVSMPPSIKSFVVSNEDMSFTIVLNDSLSIEQNRISYLHEYNHILRGDFDKKSDVDLIELQGHA